MELRLDGKAFVKPLKRATLKQRYEEEIVSKDKGGSEKVNVSQDHYTSETKTLATVSHAFAALRKNVTKRKRDWAQRVVADAHAKSILMRRCWKPWERLLRICREKEAVALQQWKYVILRRAWGRLEKYWVYRTQRRESYTLAQNQYQLKLKKKYYERLLLNKNRARVLRWKIREFQLKRSLSENKRIESEAFIAWKDNAAESTIIAVSHYKSKLSLKFVSNWTKFLHERKLKQSKVQKASRFHTIRLMWKCWTLWSKYSRESLQERRKKKLSKAIESYFKNLKTTAFTRMYNQMVERRREKRNAYLAALFRYHVLMNTYFQTWFFAAKPRIRRAKIERLSIQFYYKKKTSLTFYSWKQLLRVVQQERNQNVQAIQHWATQHKRKYMILWAQGAAASIVSRTKFEIAAQHHKVYSFGQALRSLKSYAEKRSKQRELIEIAREGWEKRRKIHTITEWHEWSHRHRSFRGQLNEADIHFKKVCLNTAFAKLLENMLKERKRSALLENILTTIIETKSINIQQRCFMALGDYCKNRIVSRISKLRADGVYEKNLIRKMFLQWNNWSNEHRATRLLSRQSLALYAKTTISRFFRLWCTYLLIKRQRTEQHTHATLLWALHTKKRVWKAWAGTFMGMKNEKKKRAAVAIEWRRKYLVRIGAYTWLNASISSQMRREQAIQEITAAKAAALTRRVAKYAYHWRAVVLRRRLQKQKQSMGGYMKMDTNIINFPGRYPKQFPVKDIDTPRLNRDIPRSTNFSNDNSLAKSQLRAALSLDWIDEIIPNKRNLRQRPLPRRINFENEDQENWNPSPSMRVSSIEIAAPHVKDTFSVNAMISNPSELERAREVVHEYERRKLRAKKERVERSSLRKQLRELSESEGDSIIRKELLDRLDILQKKKAEFEAYKARIFPHLRVFASMTSNACTF